jgi:DNA modification methylase
MDEQLTFEFEQRPTIKGFPELRWTGKRPYRSTQYYPAQLRESYGEEQNGWISKIFWGDNLQVMSHLLKEYRGKIDLIYIDPPFASDADYKRKIKVKNQAVVTDSLSFEEKQYGDIWNNDEYLQFMYERLLIMRELLSINGTIFVHCDWRVCSYMRLLMDEVFGKENFLNEIIWNYSGGRIGHNFFGRKHDNIYWYAKKYGNQTFNYDAVRQEYAASTLARNRYRNNGSSERVLDYKPNEEGKFPEDVWTISIINPFAKERLDYPTQKPERLIEDIIKAASNPGDLVFDCFMGSGTTQAVAMKLGRRFVGADINLGAVQTTTKRLLSVAKELEESQTSMGSADDTKYTGFEVYNVNNYDFFRNPVEARDLLIAALEIQPFPQSDVWDGELDGRMVKIMPVNRIATKADLKELLANLPYKTYEKRKEENPNQPVERITIVCMGHEPDLKGAMEQELTDYKVDIQIMDILRDKADLQLKRDSEAEIVREGGKLVIRAFYPMNLMQKLSLQKEYVEDWRQLVDSIMIDWNYDGVVMQPAVTDVPGKNEMVKGIYDIPEGCGTIKVKITDLLSESLEVEVR